MDVVDITCRNLYAHHWYHIGIEIFNDYYCITLDSNLFNQPSFLSYSRLGQYPPKELFVVFIEDFYTLDAPLMVKLTVSFCGHCTSSDTSETVGFTNQLIHKELKLVGWYLFIVSNFGLLFSHNLLILPHKHYCDFDLWPNSVFVSSVLVLLTWPKFGSRKHFFLASKLVCFFVLDKNRDVMEPAKIRFCQIRILCFKSVGFRCRCGFATRSQLIQSRRVYKSVRFQICLKFSNSDNIRIWIWTPTDL